MARWECLDRTDLPPPASTASTSPRRRLPPGPAPLQLPRTAAIPCHFVPPSAPQFAPQTCAILPQSEPPEGACFRSKSAPTGTPFCTRHPASPASRRRQKGGEFSHHTGCTCGAKKPNQNQVKPPCLLLFICLQFVDKYGQNVADWLEPQRSKFVCEGQPTSTRAYPRLKTPSQSATLCGSEDTTRLCPLQTSHHRHRANRSTRRNSAFFGACRRYRSLTPRRTSWVREVAAAERALRSGYLCTQR